MECTVLDLLDCSVICIQAKETLNKTQQNYSCLSDDKSMTFFSLQSTNKSFKKRRILFLLCVRERHAACVCSYGRGSVSHSCCSGSHVEASVPGLHCPPLLEVHVDVGGYKIIHLVTLYLKKKKRQRAEVKKGSDKSTFSQDAFTIKGHDRAFTSDVSHRNLVPLTKLPIVM